MYTEAINRPLKTVLQPRVIQKKVELLYGITTMEKKADKKGRDTKNTSEARTIYLAASLMLTTWPEGKILSRIGISRQMATSYKAKVKNPDTSLKLAINATMKHLGAESRLSREADLKKGMKAIEMLKTINDTIDLSPWPAINDDVNEIVQGHEQ